MKPLCIDLFCGLGGWTEGFLAEGWDVIGFDIEQHVYGEHRYPAQLVLQDVRTIHGSQFRDAQMIVASSPCQEFSYRAMPWKRAKALGPPLLGMELFAQAARIQKEASEAAGHPIPMIQENVRGAQPWVGRAQWHFGSYYLWGDVPALMPTTTPRAKVAMASWRHPSDPRHVKGQGFNTLADRATKNAGGSWFAVAHNTTSGVGQNARDQLVAEGTKVGGGWFHDARAHTLRRHSSKSIARKAASARIAKIPAPLARHIAHVLKPLRAAAVAGGGTDG